MVKMQTYDLIVIGSGPGGYVAAIRAAQLGKKVAVIEKKAIGGTCLNVGCIPSKSYLQHSHWVLAAEEANQFGMNLTVGSIDFSKLVKRKDGVVSKLQGGIKHLFQSNQIDYMEGKAEVTAERKIKVGEKVLNGRDILLATGSRPFIPPINGIDEVDYLTTDTFFDVKTLPDKLVVIGGGIIAVELAFAMRPLGVDVTLIEVAPDILLTEDEEARQLIKKKLKKMGIKIHTAAQIDAVKTSSVNLKNGENIGFDRLLVATGRKADTTLAAQLGVELDEQKRFVKVNHHYQTNLPHVYAIGDLIGGYMLAHVASAEGIRAVEAICGQPQLPVDPTLVPRCLYTEPEVASFGLSEKEAKEKGYDVVTKKMPFAGNGKAIAGEETDGFVKIISEKQYHQILGAVIVGSHATEMIHTILGVRHAEGTVDEIASMIFAHPSLSEITGEVANSIVKKAIHG